MAPVVRGLLVEDSAGDANLTLEYLDEPDSDGILLSIHWVQRLSQALAALRAERFAFVLLDLLLPDAVGLEALHAVLATAPGVPVLVMTGLADAHVGQRSQAAGAECVLQKGDLDPGRFRRMVVGAIEGRRA